MKYLISGIAAVILIFVIVFFLLSRGKTISLNNYLDVDFIGYNEFGEALPRLDINAIAKDNQDYIIKAFSKNNKLAELDSGIEDLLAIDKTSFAEDVIAYYIGGSLDKATELSNGDKIMYIWNNKDDEIKKDLNITLKYSDKDFDVSGLEEIAKIDPFEKIEVSFTGVSKQGTAVINNLNTGSLANYRFKVENNESLENGQEVRVYISDLNQELSGDELSYEGIYISPTSKTYTVEGLGNYVEELSEIPEDIMNQFKNQAEDNLKSHVAKEWQSEVSLSETEYQGSYLLNKKLLDSYSSRNNILILVYKSKVNINYNDGEIDDQFDYYYSVSFDDILKLSDGNIKFDLLNYKTPSNNFTKTYSPESLFFDKVYRFYGYDTMDLLYNDQVVKLIDMYSYKTDIE